MSSPSADVTDAPNRLEEAIRDSHYLLAYFSRAKANIPPEKHAEFERAVTILSTFRKTPSGTRRNVSSVSGVSETHDANASEESKEISKFWHAFIMLSDLAYPATVESIRYYFKFYYDEGKPDPFSETRRGHHFRFRKTQSSFVLLTIIALFMTIGLSLLSYIGAQALVHYDNDYAHWSQVQTLVRYLDEGGKASFTGGQTAEGQRLVIKLPNALVSATDRTNPIAGRASSNGKTSDLDPISDIFLEVPTAQIPRIAEPLIDADLGDGPAASFEFSCSPIINLFARARGTNSNDAPPQGALTLKDCLGLMAKVKPHVLSIADDLAFTYSSMMAERTTLTRILGVLLLPARAAEIMSAPLTWVYDKIAEVGATQMPPAHAAETNQPPSSLAEKNASREIEEIDPTAGEAYYLFVLLQQRHVPIPFVFPNPSVNILGTVFDARLAVSITNTYLLTLAFGFLGACVWVLRDINARLQDFTLAPSLFPRYWARILLGMVAGPTIGLFFQDGRLLSFSTSATNNAPNLSTQLSAAAIAFVAGFSIEIVFAILERFIRIIQEFAGPAK
jgi:hypothetical protein